MAILHKTVRIQLDIEVEVDDSDVTEDEDIDDIAINLAEIELFDLYSNYDIVSSQVIE